MVDTIRQDDADLWFPRDAAPTGPVGSAPRPKFSLFLLILAAMTSRVDGLQPLGSHLQLRHRAAVPQQNRNVAAFSTTVPRPVEQAPKRAPAAPTKKPKDEGGGDRGKHQLLLFDDPVNTREYVSKVLCTKVGLAEIEAYDVMMQAHNNGMAVVGIYVLEQAEAYCESLRASGLVAAVKPVQGE